MRGAATSHRLQLSFAISVVMAVCGALLILAGGVSLAIADRVYPEPVRAGTLVSMPEPMFRRAKSTWLVIEDESGEEFRLQVKSSIKINENRRIRKEARTLIGQEVLFVTDRRRAGILELRTADGTVVVSMQHTRNARYFGAWNGLFLGVFFCALSAFALINISRKINDKHSNPLLRP